MLWREQSSRDGNGATRRPSAQQLRSSGDNPTSLMQKQFALLLHSMPSVYIKTYGCQMNERDSEAVAAQLVAKGYTLAPSEHVADVVLLNTCSVRDNAEQKALNKMENVAGAIRKSRPNV